MWEPLWNSTIYSKEAEIPEPVWLALHSRSLVSKIVAFAMKQLWDFMILLQPDLEAAATDFGRDLS